MNYFVTHCDKNFLKYAERLFETLSLFSINKIIFYTVDFTYNCKLDNVISIKVESKNYLQNLSNYSKYSSQQDSIKAYNVFLKPFIVKELLSAAQNYDDNYCYLDSDCLAVKDCDKIFNKHSLIMDYPLFNRGCHEFMMIDGRGDPFINNICDLNYCLEADLMKLLNVDINLRKQYLQTGVFLFNKHCEFFIDEWLQTCSRNEIVDNWRRIAPFHEETVANCLLWKRFNILDLSQSLINLPYNEYDKDISLNKIKEMLNCLANVRQEDYFIDTFCRIPALDNIKNLHFYHGKISDPEYNYIKEQMSNNFLLKINSVSLGDTLAATPTLRKLYNCYNAKIDVVTHHPELFIKNKYVNKLFSFSEKISETSYKEIFNTFLGVGGKKSEYGVEKKHNTIDIRQFHAIDLGFMLNENEMQYDYIANEYVEINNLPQSYICLHVANTWSSRTYSDENWQKLINLINDKNIPIVLVGKNSHESGFYNIDKPTKKLNFKIGLDLTNKLDISQCWHVINKSQYFITMDSGLLHLAGTTDTNIIQLGSSINYKLRAPYRNGSQNYKYEYISGPCKIFCASDVKYGVKEWKTIQGVPPLINCLENKNTFECHPDPKEVSNSIKSNLKKSLNPKIEVFNIDKDPVTVHYRSINGNLEFCQIKVLDIKTKTILYSEYINISQGVNYWTSVGNSSSIITNNIQVLFYNNNEIIFDKIFEIYKPDRITAVSHLSFDYDLNSSNLYEIYVYKSYVREDVKIEPEDIVVDIGSNLSTFIHYALENKASKVYSCEPTAYCLGIINKYFKNNPKVVINDVAISDKNGETFFDIISDGHGGNKLTSAQVNDPSSYASNIKEKVKTQTFKTFIENNKIQNIDFLKIDCEGGEFHIFVDENKDFFKNNVHKIALEYHNEEKENIKSYLKSLNYKILETMENNLNYTIGMIYAKNKNFNKNPTTLFLAPHLSTGGSPAYLKWLIEENIKNNVKPVVIEYCNYGSYDVQKKQIIDIVGKDNFYTFGNHWDSDIEYNAKSPDLIKLIESINPSIIHLNEISEIFSLKRITPLLFNFLYDKNRKFKLIETCHTSEFNFHDKKYLPDCFDFCSSYHLELSKYLNVEKNIVEMTIPNKLRPERSEILKKLNLNPDYFHVLNVGLFTEGKNQKYLFDLARKLSDKKIIFHFIGNTCWIDNCGITEQQKQMSNCVIWNERDDVDMFMSCVDLFVFPSLKELNPISIKEALSWSMPCYINRLETYAGKYDNHPLVNYIENDNLFNLLNNIPYVQ
jgi:FkbM family methyltransferase